MTKVKISYSIKHTVRTKLYKLKDEDLSWGNLKQFTLKDKPNPNLINNLFVFSAAGTA